MNFWKQRIYRLELNDRRLNLEKLQKLREDINQDIEDALVEILKIRRELGE